MGSDNQRYRGFRAGKLLDDDRGADGIESNAVVFLGNHDAKEAQLGHLWNQLGWKTRRLVARCRSRRNLRFGKIADRLLEKFFFLREIKIHNPLRSLPLSANAWKRIYRFSDAFLFLGGSEFTKLTISSSGAPGVKISLTPIFLRLRMSSCGTIPPPNTAMSGAFFFLRSPSTSPNRVI